MNAVQMAALVLIVADILGLAYGSFSYTKETHKLTVGPIDLTVRTSRPLPVWAVRGGDRDWRGDRSSERQDVLATRVPALCRDLGSQGTARLDRPRSSGCFVEILADGTRHTRTAQSSCGNANRNEPRISPGAPWERGQCNLPLVIAYQRPESLCQAHFFVLLFNRVQDGRTSRIARFSPPRRLIFESWVS
jgi:hypothetical protein